MAFPDLTKASAGYPSRGALAASPTGLETYAEIRNGRGYRVATGVVMIGKLGSRPAVSADGLRNGVAVICGVFLVVMATSILTGLIAT